MEFDFYNPQLKLAIEYQGEQHFSQTHRGKYNRQLIRDEQKREECLKLGITLIEIPFYKWDNNINTLKEFLLPHFQTLFASNTFQ